MKDNGKILPVEEMIFHEEFTGRDKELRKLDSWVKRIQRRGATSISIIAPRRMGKSVLLDRLVNTIFFKPEYNVVPFYIRIERKDVTLHKFLLTYATTFFRQYIAYCLQDPLLYRQHRLDLKELLDYPSNNHKAIKLAQQFIREFLTRYHEHEEDDAQRHWDKFVFVPEDLASFSGVKVVVIIDEFQDMKFFMHNVPESQLDFIRADREKNPDRLGTNLTATYSHVSQSRLAPMLVSGSAVTMIFKTVMGGALAGRFGHQYLKPLSIADGAILLQTVLELYTENISISTESALYASTQVGGHPYYLYCLAISDHENKLFNSKADVDRIIQYEIEYGKIGSFWQVHFENNRRYINSDEDAALGRKIIYYFTQYNNQLVDTKTIASKLNVPKTAVDQKIRKLYQADLVYRRARYYAFNDICLMRFIHFFYADEIEGLEKIDLSEQSRFNNLKGRFLEIIVQVTMMKFNDEELDGAWYGRPAQTIKAPLFQIVDSKQTKGSTTRNYQLDVVGKTVRRDLFWVCECKYTRKKMNLSQVHKLEKAAIVLKQELKESEQPIPHMQLWLVSTGGFTNEVLRYVEGREDIYFTDHDGINNIFGAYGGNYNIPLFNNE